MIVSVNEKSSAIEKFSKEWDFYTMILVNYYESLWEGFFLEFY